MMVLKGHLYLEHQRIDEAQMCFQKAVDASKMSPDILLRIAISVYDNNYINLAYNMFYSLLEASDGNIHDGYSYLAVCAYELGNYDDYLQYLRKAIIENPREARNVLNGLFPEDMEPERYYEEAKRQLKK